MTDHPDPTRRSVLRAAGTAGAAALTVAACGSGDGSAAVAAAPSTPVAAGGTLLAKVADVPVGGGVVLIDLKLVVTQPTAGEFKAFSSICPHQGCPVSAVKDGYIDCTCHGSRFAVATGAPTPDSPAKSPLAPQPVTVEGADVVTA
ncbi:MAG: Rieske (2Fe-2S) protein [Actinomycetota bacterium]